MNRPTSPRFDPKIREFHDAQKAVLAAKLKGVRAAISHPGEKGRSIEIEVANLLRSFLPSEYGIGTGFVMYHDDSCLEGNVYSPDRDYLHLSEQIDIIIYDALRGGPIIHLDSCDVFPLEAVIAYVEVKTSLSSTTALRKLFDQSNRLRSMKARFFWGTVPSSPTEAQLLTIPLDRAISIRAYAFVGDGDSIGTSLQIKHQMERISKSHGGSNTFLTGLYINNRGLYSCQPVPTSDDKRIGRVNLES